MLYTFPILLHGSLRVAQAAVAVAYGAADGTQLHAALLSCSTTFRALLQVNL